MWADLELEEERLPDQCSFGFLPYIPDRAKPGTRLTRSVRKAADNLPRGGKDEGV